MHFVVAYSIPYMIKNLRYGTFFLFGTTTLLSAVIVFIWVPETKSFPLEKMNLIFDGSRCARTARKDAETSLAEEERLERVRTSASVEMQETVVISGGKDVKATEATA